MALAPSLISSKSTPMDPEPIATEIGVLETVRARATHEAIQASHPRHVPRDLGPPTPVEDQTGVSVTDSSALRLTPGHSDLAKPGSGAQDAEQRDRTRRRIRRLRLTDWDATKLSVPEPRTGREDAATP